MESELIERIRDIRASEKVFYRQILEIYATSIDYDHDPKAEESVRFFEKVQNKIHYAISGGKLLQKLYIVVQMRKRIHGLNDLYRRATNVKGAKVAKNYLNEKELQAMNKVETEYKKYKQRTISSVEREYLDAIKQIQKDTEVKLCKI